MRRFASDLSPDALDAIQGGLLSTSYRGKQFLKSPFDVLLYMQLVGSLRPRTVIEIGTLEGGSALWFADCLDAHGIDGRVISIDVENPPDLEDERISFLRGDATALDRVLGTGVLAGLPRPFLVTEDSAHYYETCLGVLEFFHPHLRSGEYVVIEDGVVAQLPQDFYRLYEDGPNRAVRHFLEHHPGEYEVDEELCDRYGYNVTWAPNGWLRRR